MQSAMPIPINLIIFLTYQLIDMLLPTELLLRNSRLRELSRPSTERGRIFTVDTPTINSKPFSPCGLQHEIMVSSELNSKIKTQKLRIIELESQLHSCKHQLEKQEQANSDLLQKLSNLDHLQLTLSENDFEIKKLKRENKEFEEEAKAVQEEFDEARRNLENQIFALQELLDTEKLNNDHLRMCEINYLKEEIQRLQYVTKEKEVEAKDLKNQLHNQQQYLNSQQINISMELAIEKNQEEISLLNQQLQAKTLKIEDLSGKVSVLLEKNAKLSNLINQLEAQADDSLKFQDELNELSFQLSELQSCLIDKDKVIDEKNKEIKKLSQKLQKETQDYIIEEQQRKYKQDLENQNKHFQKIQEHLNDQIKALQLENQKQMATINKQNKKLQADLYFQDNDEKWVKQICDKENQIQLLKKEKNNLLDELINARKEIKRQGNNNQVQSDVLLQSQSCKREIKELQEQFNQITSLYSSQKQLLNKGNLKENNYFSLS